MFTVRTNMPALYAHNRAVGHQKDIQKALVRLSTGYRINSAADDAAGLGISERMRGQIRGLEMASRNAQNALSMVQTADGTLGEIQSIMQRMRELALQAANGTYSDEEREYLNMEYKDLMDELDRLSLSANFNQIDLFGGAGGQYGEENLGHLGLDSGNFGYGGGAYAGIGKLVITKAEDGTAHFSLQLGDKTLTGKLLGSGDVEFTLEDGSTFKLTGIDTEDLFDGTVTGIVFDGQGKLDLSSVLTSRKEDEVTFQIGANGGRDQQLGTSFGDASTGSLGSLSGSGMLLRDTDILTPDNALAALEVVDEALKTVNHQRARLGAAMNSLERTIDSLATAIENLVAAESRIRDADMAEEMMKFVKSSMLLQAAQAMMSQAMLQPNSIIEMLHYL